MTGDCFSRLLLAIVKRLQRCWSRYCLRLDLFSRSLAEAASISVISSNAFRPAILSCAGRAVILIRSIDEAFNLGLSL